MIPFFHYNFMQCNPLELRNMFFIGSCLALLTACNAYRPFNSITSDQDRLEEGQRCLKNNDYGCAITQYSSLTNPQLQNEQLCLAYLGKGGVTLTALINTIDQNSSKMLGRFAQTLVPWNNTEASDLASAQTYCTAYASNPISTGEGVLLQALASLADCAVRIAKTDQYQGISDSDTTCNTPGPNTGTLTSASIGPPSGAISASSPGMCASDVTACVADIAAIGSGGLGSAGLNTLQNALNNIPSDLKNSAAALSATRVAIESTI
jgi:hypothetical protein